MQQVAGLGPCLARAFAGFVAEAQGTVVAGGDQLGFLFRPGNGGDVAGMAGHEIFLLSGFCVPNFEFLVRTTAGDQRAVRLVGEREHRRGVGLDLHRLFAFGQAPKTDQFVGPSGGQRFAVGRDGEVEDGPAVGLPGQALGQVASIPKGDLSCLARGVGGGDECRVVGGEGHRRDASWQVGDLIGKRPVGGVPKQHFAEASGGQTLAVGVPRDGLDDVAVAGEPGQGWFVFFGEVVNGDEVAVAGGDLFVVRREGEGEHRLVAAGQLAKRSGVEQLGFDDQLGGQPLGPGVDPLAKRGDLFVAQLFLWRHVGIAAGLDVPDHAALRGLAGEECRAFAAALEGESARGEVEVALVFFGVMAADAVVAQEVHRAPGQVGASGPARRRGAPGAWPGGQGQKCQLGQAGGCELVGEPFHACDGIKPGPEARRESLLF